MKRVTSLILIFLPVIVLSQELQFELQPGAFPVEVSGWEIFQPWTGGNNKSTPELCDIDADDDLDFFLGDERGYVYSFQNTGSSLQPDFQYETSFFDSLTHPNPTYNGAVVRFVDIDDDSDFDAFVGGSYVSVYLNNGSIYQPQFELLEDSLRDNNLEIVVGTYLDLVDIDGDGDYDLFAGHYSGYLKYYENIGTGTSYSFNLVSSNWFNTYCSEGYASPCFGDLDLLIGTGEGTLYYYRNDGDSASAQMTLVSDNYLDIDVGDYASPELADIDGDGDLDLFVGRDPTGFGNSMGDVYFYENIGTPQVPDFQLITTNYICFDMGDGATPNLVDIDADGDPDLFTGKGDNLLFYRNVGNLNEPRFVYESENFGGVNVNTLMPWFVDLDADGDYDLLAGEGAIPGPPGLHLFTNRGTPQNPQFTLTTNNLVPGVFGQGSVLLIPGTTDIDADGDQDLFVSDVSGGLYFFENIGSASQHQFQFVTNDWQNLGTWGHRLFCFYDIDSDGDEDLFINSNAMYNQPWDKNLMFYRNVGTPQNAVMVLENEDLFPELMIWQARPYLLDIDQDGDGDLFVGDLWGGIRFFRNLEVNSVNREAGTVNRSFSLLPNYPNPFNSSTTIPFTIDRALPVKIVVYNQLGQCVATLVDGQMSPGQHQIQWDASILSTGVYLISLESDGIPQQARKVILLK
ncbi:MAG: T9SS type A sorting domain-containing protein [candidate division Zixibacteria bacterium]|nr:T9SS type A sorting domain-containing protein [Candidatus Tariuqbacter arcticus]